MELVVSSDKSYVYYRKILRKHACRLRYIIHQLSSGRLTIEDLKKNLEYATMVLETAYVEESRCLCDEDEDFADVGGKMESVPSEVRDWLATTFTKRSAAKTTVRQRSFKSVATAITTGIFFDRLFRNLIANANAHIPDDIQSALKDINNWSFDVFYLDDVSKGNSLKYMGFHLFNKYGFLVKYKIAPQTLDAYFEQLQAGYSHYKNPYHNLIHAADVAQSTHWMISQTGLLECLSQLETFACLFAAIIHDYDHTGNTNNFHVQSNSDFALLYNDRSVLENHHVSSCFRLLKNKEMNILAALTREEFRDFRNLVIELVLATDMSTHFLQIKTMKTMFSLPEKIDKPKALCLLVHACDISHPTKAWNIHKIWTSKVVEEFFRQGDVEASLGLPYSPLCDRNSVQIAPSQIGFIDFIVQPSMEVCAEMLVKLVEPLVQMPVGSNSHDQSTDELPSDSFLNPNIDSSPIEPVLYGPGQKLPLTDDGRLCIPTPWLTNLASNKACWKEQAEHEETKKKKTAEKQSERTEKPQGH